jgi:hypothetical protein
MLLGTPDTRRISGETRRAIGGRKSRSTAPAQVMPWKNAHRDHGGAYSGAQSFRQMVRTQITQMRARRAQTPHGDIEPRSHAARFITPLLCRATKPDNSCAT